jgi:hypothetical protein
MSMGHLSIFCRPWFLSSVVSSFPCRGHSHSLLRYLIFFEVIVNGIVFLFLSQSVHYWYVKRLLIFVNWFCILLLCWGCFWCLRSFLVEFLGSCKYITIYFQGLVILVTIFVTWEGKVSLFASSLFLFLRYKNDRTERKMSYQWN